MNKRLKELAVQAGCDEASDYRWVCSHGELERFAELVRQDEREACAKLCEETTNLGWFAKEIRARNKNENALLP